MKQLCEACEHDEHWSCGMQTWCECDCDGPETQGYSYAEDELHQPGCLFPGARLMPSDHFMSECHTAEMLEPPK